MKAVLAILLALMFAVELSAQLTLRSYPAGSARARQLADLSRYLRRTTILRARRDQPRECAASAPGVDVPRFRDAITSKRHLYLTDPPSDVVALDVKTGRPLWTYRRSLPDDLRACCGEVNRGVARSGI